VRGKEGAQGKQGSTTIDLMKLEGEHKHLVESMAHELESPEREEAAADSRWPTRFISDIKKARKKD